ncbi:MAG: hypothetical protein ACLR3C_01865 [Eggerthella lenta]
MTEMVAERTRARAVRPAGTLAGGLPCGRRVPKGRVRWYPLKVREGSEASTCAKLLRAVPRDVLIDCFPLRKERWFKRAGVGAAARDRLPGLRVRRVGDPAELSKAISKLSVQAELAGADGARGCRSRRTPRSGSSAAWTKGTSCAAPLP